MMRATLNSIGQAATDLAPTLNDSIATVLTRTHQLLRWPVSRGIAKDLRQLESKAFSCWTTFLEAIFQGRKEISPTEVVEPETVLLSALEWVRPRARESRSRISVSMEAGLPTINADPVVLEQAFLLLLMGSVLSVDEEGGEVDLQADLFWESDAPMVRITIRDERAAAPIKSIPGIGVSSQGMALVVAKDVIEEHGGTFEVKGGPFTGIDITILLPGNLPEGVA
jgi:C4-dicarboxylate-specific signal transduction histidine kinase